MEKWINQNRQRMQIDISSLFHQRLLQNSEEVFDEIKTKYQFESVVCVLAYPLFPFNFSQLVGFFQSTISPYICL